MKKILLTLAAVVCCAMFVSAQDAQKDRNRKYNITLGKVQYAHHDDKMSADEAVGKIISGALTGKVIDNPTVGGWGSGNSQFDTSDKAIQDAIAHLSTHVSNYLNKYRPLRANIIESGASKKDKQKEVYIDLGSSEGAFVGLSMNVYQVKKIAGREAKSKIGKLRIEAVEGDDISRCKVTSGAKDIKACLDDGDELRVQSASR